MSDVSYTETYYAVSENKPEIPGSYPPDDTIWSLDNPELDSGVYTTLCIIYQDNTFSYSEVVPIGEPTEPTQSPTVKEYYLLVECNADPPGIPNENPPSGWYDTEPSYDQDVYDLYVTKLSEYEDGSYTFSVPEMVAKPDEIASAITEEPTIKIYYFVASNGADPPNPPTSNLPESTWSELYPEYDYVLQDLYSVTITEYSDGTFDISDVQRESAPEEVPLEISAGNGVYYSASEPTGGEYNDGDVWFCTASEGDNAGGIFIYNKNEDGTGSWIAHQVGTVSVKDGSITADKIVVNDVFAGLVLSKDIVATGKITATNLNITGDSTFSGALNGATGTFSGSLNAEQIDIQSEVVRDSDGTAGTSTLSSRNLLHPSSGYPNPRVVMAAETPRGENSVAVYSNEAGGNVCLQSLYIVPGDENVTTQLFVRPEGVIIQGEDVITSEDGEQPPNASLLRLYGDLYVSSGYDGGGYVRIEKNLTVAGGIGVSGNVAAENDLTVAGKINGCTICNRDTVGGTFVYGGSVALDTSSNGQTWAAAHPSYVGSIKDGGSWYNYISVRHQNGSGDGNKYGMRLLAPLHSMGNLTWQQHIDSWGTAKVIVDSSNISTYLPTGAPGTKGGAQFASGGINVGSVSAGSYKDYPHTFSGTFGGTPNVVVCTYESSAGTSASGNVARKAIVTKRSSTGFTVRLYNNSSSAWNPYVEYIAIYKG